MKLLINLAIISLFPFFLVNQPEKNTQTASAASTKLTQSVEPYCNGRFDFCLEYPTTLLVNKEEGANDDGIELYNDAGTFQVAAYGAYDLFGWDAQEIYDFNMQSYASQEAELIVLSQSVAVDHYTTSFLHKGFIHYQEVWLSGDHYLTLNISVPEGQKEWLEMLRQSVKLIVKA